MERNPTRRRWLAVIGPGILIAATGVGTGDLVTGALAPGQSGLGLAVLWAVLIGAFLKFLLTEGLTRFQLASGDTLLDGAVKHLGRPVRWVFLVYLLLWTYFTGAALMGACGVTANAILPLFEPQTGKIVYGLLHSAAAVVLVKAGGFRLFEKTMSVCIALMFITVITTAIVVKPSWSAVAAGFVPPNLFALSGDALQWSVALMGGVGGTLTILCYGYWIREEGRRDPQQIPLCRADLATGYTVTALFGIAMVIIGSRIQVTGKGADLLVLLSSELRNELGPAAGWLFLIGAWGAIFSSLFGVWQSVPYLFADFWYLPGRETADAPARPFDLTKSKPYRLYLYTIATLPAAGLWGGFAQVQKLYAIFGALFIPLLAVVLLLLNGRGALVGPAHRNRPLTVLLLVMTIAFFLLYGWLDLRNKLGL